jgi:glyoxylate/hydroxypyruvate reductase A
LPVLLFKSDFADPPPWKSALQENMPELEVRLWPEVGDARDIDYALVWKPPVDLFDALPNLKVIFSLGAGLDHLLNGVRLPTGVPVVRMHDTALTEGMSEYTVYMALRHLRRMAVYEQQQNARQWRPHLPQLRASEVRAGVLGLGVIGAAVAGSLAAVGFDVAGWSRAPKDIAAVHSFHGDDQFDRFLARTDILVCVLPLTEATHGIINATNMRKLPRGAYVINIGRGEHLVEQDLLELLAQGHIGGAALDVFRVEPLPDGHPFWTHPRITLTPHCASLTNPFTASQHVVANIHRAMRGQPLSNVADLARGY